MKYRCDHCDEEWDAEWSFELDDNCPKCDVIYSPYDSTDLTVVFKPKDLDGKVVVELSPPSAETDPEYQEIEFDSVKEAREFIKHAFDVWEVMSS